MCEIKLTNGKVILVDCDIYEEVKKGKGLRVADKNGYVYMDTKVNGKRKTVLLHRYILGLETGDKRVVDHINRNTLDNRRNNLRIGTNTLNRGNQIKRKDSKSLYKGVQYEKRTKTPTYTVKLTFEGKQKHYGTFKCVHCAGRKYNEIALELFGEFARLNTVQECECVARNNG